MSKAVLKGLAKIDVKEEVELCIGGLRSGKADQIEAGAQQLEYSLAKVVGSYLLPFCGRIGGELLLCCKKQENKDIDALWDAAAALSIVLGKAAAKTIVEPLLDLLTRSEAHRTHASLNAARTLVVTSGQLISSNVRTALDYVCIKALYDMLVFSDQNQPQSEYDFAFEYVHLLSSSITTAGALSTSNPLRPHAIAVLSKAAGHRRLSTFIQTTAISTLRALDHQIHCQADPLVVPTLEELKAHLKKLNGDGSGEEGEGMGFFGLSAAMNAAATTSTTANTTITSTSTSTYTSTSTSTTTATAAAVVSLPPPEPLRRNESSKSFGEVSSLTEDTQAQLFSPLSSFGSPLESIAGRKRSRSPEDELQTPVGFEAVVPGDAKRHNPAAAPNANMVTPPSFEGLSALNAGLKPVPLSLATPMLPTPVSDVGLTPKNNPLLGLPTPDARPPPEDELEEYEESLEEDEEGENPGDKNGEADDDDDDMSLSSVSLSVDLQSES